MPPVPFPWRCLALLNFAVVSAAPAVSLQDPAGQELILLSLAINAAMMGPFALVENEMVFQNPQAKRMEGRFSFVLPMDSGSAAMPSRLAMEIQGKLMEGEVVNRSKAQRVYREILHEARDPALLEQSAGNLFTARVFPIEPHAVVRLILSYAITLPMRELHRRLLIPLAGLPEIHNFTFSASVQSLSGGFSANCSLPTDGTNMPGLMWENGALGFSTSETHLVPSSDIQLDVWEPMAFTRTFSVDGGQLVSSFVLDSNSSSSQAFSPETWIIYIDTSASTADSFLVRIPVIEALLQQVPLSTHGVKVLAFDIEVTEVMEISGASAEEFSLLASSVSAQLRQRLPLGATDFEKLLRDVETRVPAAGQELGVLILSDCIATANERAEKRLQQLLTPGLGRVVEVAVIGSKFDSPLGSAIASAGAGRIVNIPLTSKDLSSVAAQAWLDLTKPMGQRGELVPGGGNAWIWPQAAFDLHVPIRTAYDCAPKCFRAQFLCLLNRAAMAEAKRFNDCVRGSWPKIMQTFPEMGLWRELRQAIHTRVWDTTGEPLVAAPQEPVEETKRSKSRKRSRSRSRSRRRRDRDRGRGNKREDGTYELDDGRRHREDTNWYEKNPIGSRGRGPMAERERKRDLAWDSRWTTSEDDGPKPQKATEEQPPEEVGRDPREVISAHPSGYRACKWARKWRSAMAAILPSGFDAAVPLTDTEVRKLGLLLWKDIVSWAEHTEINRYLGLFRADHQNSKTFGWDGKESGRTRGLEPMATPAEWSFVPVTDLFLVVGEGLVGITTEGIFAEKLKGQGRSSLRDCYKKREKENKNVVDNKSLEPP